MIASQISQMINEVWDGVERSKVGKITIQEGEKEAFSTLAYQTFLSVLSSVTPKNMQGSIKLDE